MGLFDQLVETALESAPDCAALRPAVEKELFHDDILREMNGAGFLKRLTFFGGTCLRRCYGSVRMSEDLDFAGGFGFSADDMSGLSTLLREALERKYNFPVTVSEPAWETGNTETWKIKIVTRPEKPDFPSRRINIDICALPSYERMPAMLRNIYGVEMGTSGLILYAESMREILIDKMIAFALRPNRVKNRDLWDIVWLRGRGITWPHELLTRKLSDRGVDESVFAAQYRARLDTIRAGQDDFIREMRRFLPSAAFTPDLSGPLWWEHLLLILRGFLEEMG